MNIVQKYLSEIADDDLRAGVTEMATLERTGVLPDGVVRRMSAELAQQSLAPGHEARKIIESAVLRLAAYRWVESTTTQPR